MKPLAMLILLPFLLFATIGAQTLPSCQNTAEDADGDGFGWSIRSGQSCVVDATTGAAPSYIHEGQPVQLTRAYWDANRDLAGRTLACEEYTRNDGDSDQLTASYLRYHDPLPPEKPWISSWTMSSRVSYQSDGTETPENDETRLWTVVDGRLDDKLPGSPSCCSEPPYWVELISVNGGSENATRWWDPSGNKYHQCTDPLTNSFIPTGSPNVTPAAPTTNYSQESIVFTSAEEETQPASPYRYGEREAVLSRGAMWNIQDLAFKRIDCNSYMETTTGGGETYFRFIDEAQTTIRYLPPLETSPRSGYVAYTNWHNSSIPTLYTWAIDDDNTIDVGPFRDWFELASFEGHDVLRFWDGAYRVHICELSKQQFDTPYSLRDTTQEEYDSFLIETNIDTSHCTTPANAYPLTLNNFSCLLDSEITDQTEANTGGDTGTTPTGPSDVELPAEDNTHSMATETDSTDTPTTAQEDLDSSNSQQDDSVTTANNPESGGGSLDAILMLMLLVFFILVENLRTTRARA